MNQDKQVIALGFFDGVHLGHQALLAECCRLAQKLLCVPAAITFQTHPLALLSGKAPKLINTPRDRQKLLYRYGMEQVRMLTFDQATMSMPWQRFWEQLLEQGAAGIVCGHDFRFGHRGEGTAEKLQAACAQRGIACSVVPEQAVEGIRISSTYIRTLLETGDMDRAIRFLGHPHLMTGTVVSGRGLGHTIGVPTANLSLPEEVLCPRFGVYACTATVDGKTYNAVTNVGTRPTVGGHRVTVEPWLLDFSGDLYGKELSLEFYHFLRPETKFDSLDALKEQIRTDAQQTRAYFK